MTPESAIGEHIRFLPEQLDPLSPLDARPRGGVNANGVLEYTAAQVLVHFEGEAGVYQLKCRFDVPVAANSYGATFRLQGWDAIQYVAIGYSEGAQFVHIKVRHVKQGEDITVNTSHFDLAFLMQNEWSKKGLVQLQDLRIFIKGTPGAQSGASLSVSLLECWAQEASDVQEEWSDVAKPALLEPLFAYWTQCFPDFTERAERYLRQGEYPASGEAPSTWGLFEERPDGHDLVSTNRFSWHALHAVSILLLAYRKQQDVAYLFAARDMTSRWIEQSYQRVDPDQKYAWYDHGTAERTVVFVALWHLGLELRFDYRFMARLASVLFRHTQLLASDAFYAFHQPTRYHNHACFQDVALIAAAACQAHVLEADAWLDKAEKRLQDQLQQLVHHEQGYAIFTENSIGYHCRMQELAQLASELLQCLGRGAIIAQTASLMHRWSQEFIYPDGHWPCHGDTFRKAVPCPPPKQWGNKLVFLPEAGYCLVKGEHAGSPWILGVVGTNLNTTHKQHDDLSFFLWLGGVEWFVDPSFYNHEYQQSETAYLRSPRAHNMLSVAQTNYSVHPDPERVFLRTEQGVDALGNARITVSGTHCAYEDIKVHRVLHCPGDGEAFFMQCTDRFEPTMATTATLNAELSFHFGEGVEVTSLGEAGEPSCFRLSHPRSSHSFTLHIDIPMAVKGATVSLERSISGTVFLKTVPTTVIRVKIPPYNDCTWTLNVTAA